MEQHFLQYLFTNISPVAGIVILYFKLVKMENSITEKFLLHCINCANYKPRKETEEI